MTYIKKFVKKIAVLMVLVAGVFSLIVPIFSAQSVYSSSIDVCELAPGGCVKNIEEASDEKGANDIALFILKLADILTMIVIAISVLYIILGAWFIITGIGGDGPTYEKGLKILKNAVLGLIVALLALTIVGFITNALGKDGIFKSSSASISAS